MRKFDGFIITGAPVEQMEFEEVDYWQELTEIMEWTKTNVTSTLHLCWDQSQAEKTERNGRESQAETRRIIMIKTPVVVKTEEDFDGRPIALLVQEASQYASTIYIQVGEKHINAKSIMGMMSLSLADGEEITVVTDGEDEQRAAEGIKTFFAKGRK